MPAFEYFTLDSEWFAILNSIVELRKYDLAVANRDLPKPEIPFHKKIDALVNDGLEKWKGVYLKGDFTCEPLVFVRTRTRDGQERYSVNPATGGPLLDLDMPCNLVQPDGLLQLGIGSLAYPSGSPKAKAAYLQIQRLMKKQMERHEFAMSVWMGREARKLLVEKRAYVVGRGVLGLPPGNDPLEADRLARLKLGLPER